MKSKCCNEKIVKYVGDTNLVYCSKCLCITTFKKKAYNVITSVFIFILLLLISAKVFAPINFNKEIKTILKEDIVLTDSSVLKYMNEIGILFPELVLQQIHWESGHFKSKICKENHNFLGIRYIKQKEAIGEKYEHAVFPTYKACLRDYKRLQKHYIKNLVGKYAEDPEYGKKLFGI